ncbi:hypothetical protein AB3R30_05450 [Leptolyngbyaceae cyanobacterium UHCC 1019]
MSKQIYKWKRFWCPRSGSINLADGGYLCAPDTDCDYPKIFNICSFNRIEKLMAEQSNPNFSGATFNAPVNFAPNYGNQAQNLSIQNTEQNFEVVLTDFKQFVADLQTQNPNVKTSEAATQTITVQAKKLPQPRLQNFLNLK